jgi:hypothetical protein
MNRTFPFFAGLRIIRLQLSGDICVQWLPGSKIILQFLFINIALNIDTRLGIKQIVIVDA